MDNAATRILKKVSKKLNQIDERQKQSLFSTYDFELVEKINKKYESIKRNN